MSQKLILPFANNWVTAGYKKSGYTASWGYPHYGCDYVSGVAAGASVIASGAGTVVTAGFDNAVGNVIAIVYSDVLNHKTGALYSLVARYMHLKSIAVKVGQTVKAGDVIGVEGNTGSGNWSAHLHVEFDTDTRPAYYNWSPQVAGSNLIKKGTDSTVNPSYLFHRRTDQALANGNTKANWTATEDYNLPTVSTSTSSNTKLETRLSAVEAAVKTLETQVAAAKTEIAAIRKML